VRRPPPYERVPRTLQDLTQRELEVFTMISRGFANDQIAKALVVSEATVPRQQDLGDAGSAQPSAGGRPCLRVRLIRPGESEG